MKDWNGGLPARIYGIVESVVSSTYFCKYLFDNCHDKLIEFKTQVDRLPDEVLRDPNIRKAMEPTALFIATGTGYLLHLEGKGKTYLLVDLAKDLFEVIRKNILLRDDFFLWLIHQYDSGHIAEKGCVPAWIRFISSFPLSELKPEEIKTLNDWAFDQCFDLDGKRANGYIGLCESMVFGWWSHTLLDVETKALDGELSLRLGIDESRLHKDPVGYMLMPKKLDYDCADKSKMPYTNELLGDVDPEETTDDTYAPEYFSSGFHQGAPILMQMDMMKMNEVLAVENPEVHLHPGLQLTFMGFFIENALIGKYSLIETHSDLMIRRVMRAIHEEKLPQSWVNVYFVDVEQVEGKKIRTSKIDRLWLNEQGAVSNWPKGFLNDDVREAEALMRSMYGMRIQAEDEDHE